MKRVIDFIVGKKMESVDDFPTLIPQIKERFEITDHEGNEASEELVTALMFWEKHTEIYDSLEKFLNDRFIVKPII